MNSDRLMGGTVLVDGVTYRLHWQDFGRFKRVSVYSTDFQTRLGWRDLPIPVDEGYNTVRYLIRRMVLKDVAVYRNC